MHPTDAPSQAETLSPPSPDGESEQALSRHDLVLRQIERSYDLARERGAELSVIVAGLDGFRTVNERLGPIEGDEVLAAFAARLGAHITDVTHLVGDQLIGLLPGEDAAAAVALAEAIRRDIAESLVTAVGSVTASFGLAGYPDSAQSAPELVYGAQAAMYWAKAKGGNRVDHWGEMIGVAVSGRPPPSMDPVTALAIALERKIRAGPGQVSRSAWYAAQVAAEMRLERQEQELVEKAALLHDVGKLAIPDGILQKPGALTPEERAIVQAHPTVGAHIVSRLPDLTGAAPIIAHHHEHVNGGGYPDGLAGDEIPLASRIILVSDAVDAMTTHRPHRSVMSLQEALQELRRWSGRQFDKRVVDAFTTIVNRRGLQALHWSQIRHQIYSI